MNTLGRGYPGPAGSRLVDSYGAWRGVDPDDDKDEPKESFAAHACQRCGAVGHYHLVSVRRQDLAHLGPDFRAHVGRFPPEPPPKPVPVRASTGAPCP